MRRNIMHPDYEPKDDVEKWIHSFGAQNREAGGIWTDSYNEVEKAIYAFRRECVEGEKSRAIDIFMAWLQSDSVTKGTDIPFPDQAYAFADIYWGAKDAYDKDHDSAHNSKRTQAFQNVSSEFHAEVK